MMTSKQELQNRIEALKLSRDLIDDEITTVKAALEKEALKLSRNLIDGEITKAKAAIKEIEAKQKATWEENQYAQDRVTKKLAEYFHSLGYSIVSLQTKAPENATYAIAKQVWNRHEIVLPFFKFMVKYRFNEVDYPISEFSSSDKTDFLNLCKTMQDNGWLKFSKRNDSLHLQPTLRPELKIFFNGGWAEEANRYFVNKVLTEYASSHKLKYKIFWDVRLKLIDSDKENSHDMQLDLVVQINDIFYVFETKTGALGIQKWVERAEIFNQNRNRFLTCCMDSSVNPKLFQPYRLLALERLEEELTALLDYDFPQHKASNASDEVYK